MSTVSSPDMMHPMKVRTITDDRMQHERIFRCCNEQALIRIIEYEVGLPNPDMRDTDLIAMCNRRLQTIRQKGELWANAKQASHIELQGEKFKIDEVTCDESTVTIRISEGEFVVSKASRSGDLFGHDKTVDVQGWKFIFEEDE